MTTVTSDVRQLPAGSATSAGLLFALASALSFGLAGSLARGLLDAGWTPGAVVTVRVAIGALVVAPLGIRALRGRWYLLTRNAKRIGYYGAFAVAVTQFCFFSAVQYMQVGPALLIEFTAPAAVVIWLWLRHGERPTWLTVIGAVTAAAGLVLVLDLVSGADASVPGVAWSLAAMLGNAAYFVMSSEERDGLPPFALAAAGLAVGAVVLGALAVVGLLPLSAGSGPVALATWEVSAWVPLVLLGVVTAGVAYSVGIAAIRRLGSRLASFVALTEVLCAIVWAWILLGELPAAIQLAGGVLILAGVVLVQVGEVSTKRPKAERVRVNSVT